MRRFLLSLIISLCCLLETYAAVREVVSDYCRHFTLWSENGNTENLEIIEDLLSINPVFRIGNSLMGMLAKRDSLPETDTYLWQSYVSEIQKEIDKGIRISYSDIQEVPQELIDYTYPGVEYFACKGKANGSLTTDFHDLFILKNNRIAMITDYIVRTDSATGKKSVDINSFLFHKGFEMTQKALESNNWGDYDEGIRLMEKACKKEKKRADWCYQIGKACNDYIVIDGHILKWNEKNGLNWLEEGAKRGNIDCALTLFRHYRPETPASILSPKKEWKEYMKMRDKCYELADIIFAASIPTDFNDYMSLADVARFTGNNTLKNKYRALAFEREEYGALEDLMKDLDAADYITSPTKMYDFAVAIWRRYYNDSDHRHEAKIGCSLFEKAANAGHSLAQYQMGHIYLKGKLVEPDTLKAVSWLKLALKERPLVAFDLALLYLNGSGIGKDTQQGIEYLEKAVDADDSRAKLTLGKCYLYGIGTPRNTAKARELFEEVNAGIDQSSEARLMYDGYVVYDLNYLLGLVDYYEDSPNYVALFEESRKAKSFKRAERNDLLLKLASCYQEGKFGVTPDPTKAAALIKEARELMKKDFPEITSENIIF